MMNNKSIQTGISSILQPLYLDNERANRLSGGYECVKIMTLVFGDVCSNNIVYY